MSKSAANLARNTATQDQNQATGLYNTLSPLYTKMALGQPTALSTAENTAAQQSAGGGQSAAVGQLNLEAARRNNAGGMAPAADEAARQAGRTLSNDALNVTANNAKSGMAGLNSLYGTNASGNLDALKLYNDASNSTFGNQFGSALASSLGQGIGGRITSIGSK